MSVVLDASALLAWLFDEPGGESVAEILPEVRICSLNWSEVLQKSFARGADVAGLRSELEALGLMIVPFDVTDAEQAARLWEKVRHLSLADRACLALGVRLGVTVWTADRNWEGAAVEATVHLIRP